MNKHITESIQFKGKFRLGKLKNSPYLSVQIMLSLILSMWIWSLKTSPSKVWEIRLKVSKTLHCKPLSPRPVFQCQLMWVQMPSSCPFLWFQWILKAKVTLAKFSWSLNSSFLKETCLLDKNILSQCVSERTMRVSSITNCVWRARAVRT